MKIFCIPAAAYRTLYRDEPVVRDFTVNELSGRVFDLLAALEERSLPSIEDRLKGYLIRRVDGQGESPRPTSRSRILWAQREKSYQENWDSSARPAGSKRVASAFDC